MALYSVFFDRLSTIPQQELHNYFITFYPGCGPAIERKPRLFTGIATFFKSRLLGTSYSISKTAKRVCEHITDHPDLITNPLQAIQAVSRLTKIAQRVLELQGKDSEFTRVLLYSSTCELLRSEAGKRQIDPVELACTCDALPEAHVLIEQEADISSLSQESKDKLFAYFLESNNLNHAETLFYAGAKRTGNLYPLLCHFIRQKNTTAIAALLAAKAHLGPRKGKSAIVEACEANLFELVKQLADLGESLHVHGDNTNSLLHIAASKGAYEMLEWLSQRLDVTRVNDEDQTAYSLIPHYLKQKSRLEQAFLLQDIPEFQKIIATLDKEAEVKKLEQKYPKTPVMHLLYRLQKAHYRDKEFMSMPKTKAPGCSVSELTSLFRQVNLTNPQNNLYVSPESYERDTGTSFRPFLWIQLKMLISSINKQKPYMGVPTASWAQKQFYEDVEAMITHTIQKIKSMPESLEKQETIRDFVVEFLKASGRCGGRLFRTAVERYRTVHRDRPVTFKDELHFLLADYRELLFIQITPKEDHNVNTYNHMLRAHGKEFGIPGASSVTTFEDPYGSVETNQSRLSFKKLYTPRNIIFECILPKFQENGDFRENCLSWFQQNVPEKHLPDAFQYLADHVIVDMQSTTMQIKPEAAAYMLVKLGILEPI